MAFKDLFIKSEEVTQTSEPTPQSSTPKSFVQPSQPAQMPSSISSVSVNPQTTSQVVTKQSSISADETIVNKIWDKIIAANRPGPDYLELKNNVDALDDLPISNEQKLISAFKILKKGYPNFQKDDIIKAIDFYESIVNEEKDNGLKEFDALVLSNVSKVEEDIQAMQIKSEELKRQYDELQTKIGEKTIELTKAKSELDMKHNTFIGSIDAVMNVLKNDKDNIMSINF